MPLATSSAPITSSATRPIVRELPSSQRPCCQSLLRALGADEDEHDWSGDGRDRRQGEHDEGDEPIPRETFAFRISAAAATVSEYVSMNAPTRTPSSQFVRSRRSSHFGVSDVPAGPPRR